MGSCHGWRTKLSHTRTYFTNQIPHQRIRILPFRYSMHNAHWTYFYTGWTPCKNQCCCSGMLILDLYPGPTFQFISDPDPVESGPETISRSRKRLTKATAKFLKWYDAFYERRTVQFFSHLLLKFSKSAIITPKKFSWKISIRVTKKRRILWRPKQMPLKKTIAKKRCEFWVFSFMCIFSWFFAFNFY